MSIRVARLRKYLLLSRVWLAAFGFAVSNYCHSQTTYSDTATVEVVDTVADTVSAEEQPNYFDPRSTQHVADSIEFRHVPATVMDSLRNDDAFWYANTRVKKKEQQRESNTATPAWVKNLVWTLVVAAFLAALIWYLVSSNILIFSKPQKRIDTRNEEEEISENIFAINYQKELEKAITAHDHRLAIRLMFLRLLKDLSNKNIIQYRQGRTNFEYLAQAFSSGYYNDFFRLTRNYEYAWYGKFDITAETFKTIRMDFENFDHRLK